MPASTELSEAVLGQRRLLERLLANRRRDTGEEPSLRSPDAGDPEFVKNLRIFLRLVADADALYLRAAHNLSGDPAQAAAVLGRLNELRERITLPTEVPLTLEVLLGQETPAHAQFHLHFVEPRMRIGVQSAIGLDAVIARRK